MAVFSVLKANNSNKQNTVSRFKNWWRADSSIQAVKSNWQIVKDSCIDVPNKRLSLSSPSIYSSPFSLLVWLTGNSDGPKFLKARFHKIHFGLFDRLIMRMKRNWLFNELKHVVLGLIGLLWKLYLAKIPTGCYKKQQQQLIQRYHPFIFSSIFLNFVFFFFFWSLSFEPLSDARNLRLFFWMSFLQATLANIRLDI